MLFLTLHHVFKSMKLLSYDGPGETDLEGSLHLIKFIYRVV